MDTYSRSQQRRIAAQKYRLECENGKDDKCTCGNPSSEHRYGTGECMGCDSCKKFTRDMKNSYEKGDEIFVPMKNIPKEATRGFEMTHQGHRVKLTEQDEYPIGTPGWWARIV